MIFIKGLHVLYKDQVLQFHILPLLDNDHCKNLIIEQTAGNMLNLTAEFPAPEEGKEPITRVAYIHVIELFNALIQQTTHSLDLTNTGLSEIKKNHKLITFSFWAGNIVTIEHYVLLEVVSFFYQTIAVKSTDAWHVLYVGAKIDGTITLMTFFGQNEDSYRVEEFSPDFLLGLLSLKLDPHTMITVSDSYSRIIANKTVVTLHLGKPYKNRGAIVVRKDALLEAIKHVKPIVE